MKWTRTVRAQVIAVIANVALLVAVGGISHAAPVRAAPPHRAIPEYIPCSIQYAETIASASKGLSGGGILYAYLYREVDSHNHATVCGWRAYASGTSTVTAELGFLGYPSGGVCDGPIYSSVSGSGSATSGEDSDSSDAPFYARAIQGSTTVTTVCGS